MGKDGLSHRARRRWSLAILLVGLPVYAAAAVSLIAVFDRPGIVAELLIYLALGIVWALPFRFVFRGVGRDAPDEQGGGEGPV